MERVRINVGLDRGMTCRLFRIYFLFHNPGKFTVVSLKRLFFGGFLLFLPFLVSSCGIGLSFKGAHEWLLIEFLTANYRAVLHSFHAVGRLDWPGRRWRLRPRALFVHVERIGTEWRYFLHLYRSSLHCGGAAVVRLYCVSSPEHPLRLQRIGADCGSHLQYHNIPGHCRAGGGGVPPQRSSGALVDTRCHVFVDYDLHLVGAGHPKAAWSLLRSAATCALCDQQIRHIYGRRTHP